MMLCSPEANDIRFVDVEWKSKSPTAGLGVVNLYVTPERIVFVVNFVADTTPVYEDAAYPRIYVPNFPGNVDVYVQTIVCMVPGIGVSVMEVY
jgi:hypothetical protein